MIPSIRQVALAVAAIPFIYYLIALYSSWQYFRSAAHRKRRQSYFTPPVSNLKPIRGLDPDAVRKLRQLLPAGLSRLRNRFSASATTTKRSFPVLSKLRAIFRNAEFGCCSAPGATATNDKVAKLARLVSEAAHEIVVISDSDVRVRPDYLRTVVAPLADPKVGAVTCFYVPIEDKTLTDSLQTIGMFSDFYAGILVAWQLDGVKFALGPTIATTRARLAGFGGYEAIENRPADDLLVGRLIAEQGYEVELLPYTILTVADYRSLRDLFHKRLRWIVVMRHMRPWGHLGLLLTQGLPGRWQQLRSTLGGSRARLSRRVLCFAIRHDLDWSAFWGLKQHALWKKLALIPVWDAVAFVIWLTSFTRNSIRWRDGEYYIRDGRLVPVPHNQLAGSRRRS